MLKCYNTIGILYFDRKKKWRKCEKVLYTTDFNNDTQPESFCG